MTAHITKAGIIGIGSIGSAVATGLARAGHPVVISRRGAVRSAALAAAFANITAAENQSVLDQTGVGVFISAQGHYKVNNLQKSVRACCLKKVFY
jgi:predicted dinucleotide-binding enzyme